jgi:hypothetical protein
VRRNCNRRAEWRIGLFSEDGWKPIRCVAIDKATASAGLRGGNTYLLTLRGMNALPGSVPIVFESKLILIGAAGLGRAGFAEVRNLRTAKIMNS